MSARDDYETLAALADDGLPLINLAAVGSFRAALDEIDRLRDQHDLLLTELRLRDDEVMRLRNVVIDVGIEKYTERRPL